jgi:hypothetical protein
VADEFSEPRGIFLGIVWGMGKLLVLLVMVLILCGCGGEGVKHPFDESKGNPVWNPKYD